jgi:hypothetical protein
MMSEAQLRRYREMSPEERWRITEELMTLAWRALQELSYEERERRLALARLEHDQSNEALARALQERA